MSHPVTARVLDYPLVSGMRMVDLMVEGRGPSTMRLWRGWSLLDCVPVQLQRNENECMQTLLVDPRGSGAIAGSVLMDL